MATRKPSPAQLAARKLFAKRAKSGELAKERAHHQAATRRHVVKNPKRTKKQDLAIALTARRKGDDALADEFFKRAARAKNPIPTGEAIELQAFPFTVHEKSLVGRGIDSQPIAGFEFKDDATLFAKAYANKFQVSVVIRSAK